MALQNEDFAFICSQSSMKVKFGNPPYERWLQNYNRLLELYPDCIGVKTGFTDDAGRCLVSAAERDGIRPPASPWSAEGFSKTASSRS